MIYMDYAATTPVLEEVFEKMKPFFCQIYGNASSIHEGGIESKRAIEQVRTQIADFIGAKREEIIFTSGGTEGNNQIIKTVAENLRGKGNHLITTVTEHHSVLNTMKYLENRGFHVTYLKVDKEGNISLEDLKKALTKETILVSIMSGNNEIGTIHPIKEIGKIVHEAGSLFHTDAVQAYGHVPLNVQEMEIDFLSVSAHKLYGPKGVGFVYCRRDIRLEPFHHGGSQERQRRAGTLNTPGIIGLGAATDFAIHHMQDEAKRQTKLRDYMIDQIDNKITGVTINGSRVNRLPGNISISFSGVSGEAVVMLLDQKHICVSSGAACSNLETEGSHVLKAIGLTKKEAEATVRFSLGIFSTKEEIDEVVEALEEVIDRLRKMR